MTTPDVVVTCLLLASLGRLTGAVEYDAGIPQVAFGAEELKRALKEAGQDERQLVLSVHPAEDDQVMIKLDQLEAGFLFDSTGKARRRDDFLGVTVFEFRSKANNQQES